VFLFIVIVKPGPSVPISVFVRAAAKDGTARARDATIAIKASLAVRMGLLSFVSVELPSCPARSEGSRVGQLRIRLAEGESGERRRRRLYKAAGAGPDERTAPGGDQDVLLAADRIDAGGSVDATAECLLPQHLPRRGIERLEQALAADPDEDETACGRGRAADHGDRLLVLPAD